MWKVTTWACSPMGGWVLTDVRCFKREGNMLNFFWKQQRAIERSHAKAWVYYGRTA